MTLAKIPLKSLITRLSAWFQKLKPQLSCNDKILGDPESSTIMAATEDRPPSQHLSARKLAEMKKRVTLIDEDWPLPTSSSSSSSHFNDGFPSNNNSQDRNKTANPSSFSGCQHTDDATLHGNHRWQAKDQFSFQTFTPSARNLAHETCVAKVRMASPVTPTQKAYARKVDENGNLTPLPAATPPLHVSYAYSDSHLQGQDDTPLPLPEEASIFPIATEASASGPPRPASPVLFVHSAVMNFSPAKSGKESPRRPYRVSKLLKVAEARDAAKGAVGVKDTWPRVESMRREATDFVGEATRGANCNDSQEENRSEFGKDEGLALQNEIETAGGGVKIVLPKTQGAAEGFDALKSKAHPAALEEGDTEAQRPSEDLAEHSKDSCSKGQQADPGLKSGATETDRLDKSNCEVWSDGDTNESIEGKPIKCQALSKGTGDNLELDNSIDDKDNHEMASEEVALKCDAEVDDSSKDNFEPQETTSDGIDTDGPDTNDKTMGVRDADSKECLSTKSEDMNAQDPSEDIINDTIFDGIEEKEVSGDASGIATRSTDDVVDSCDTIQSDGSLEPSNGNTKASRPNEGIVDNKETPVAVMIDPYDTIQSDESLDQNDGNTKAPQPSEDIVGMEEMPTSAAKSGESFDPDDRNTIAPQASEDITDKEQTPASAAKSVKESDSNGENLRTQIPGDASTEMAKKPDDGEELEIENEDAKPQHPQMDKTNEEEKPAYAAKSDEEAESNGRNVRAQMPDEGSMETEKKPYDTEEVDTENGDEKAQYPQIDNTHGAEKPGHAAKSGGAPGSEIDDVKPTPETDTADNEGIFSHKAGHFVQGPSDLTKRHEPTASSLSFDVKDEDTEVQSPEEVNVREEGERACPVSNRVPLIASMASINGVTRSDHGFNLGRLETEMKQSEQVDAVNKEETDSGMEDDSAPTDSRAEDHEPFKSDSSPRLKSEVTEIQHARQVETNEQEDGHGAEVILSATDDTAEDRGPLDSPAKSNMPPTSGAVRHETTENNNSDPELGDGRTESQNPVTVDAAIAEKLGPVQRFITKGHAMYKDARGYSEHGVGALKDENQQKGEEQQIVRRPEKTFIERGFALLLDAMDGSVGL